MIFTSDSWLLSERPNGQQGKQREIIEEDGLLIPKRPTEEIKEFFQSNQNITFFLENPDNLSLEQIEETFFYSSETIENDKKEVKKLLKEERELPSEDEKREQISRKREEVRDKIEMHRYLQEIFLEFFEEEHSKPEVGERDITRFLSDDIKDLELLKAFSDSSKLTWLEGYEETLFRINEEIVKTTKNINQGQEKKLDVSSQELPREHLRLLRNYVGERWTAVRKIKLSKSEHRKRKDEK